MNYKTELFHCGKHQIKCLNGAYSTLEIGPDLGRSSKRPPTATRAPKLSGAALFLDVFLEITGQMKAVSTLDNDIDTHSVYGEAVIKGFMYKFMVTNGLISYAGAPLPSPYQTLPITLFFLSLFERGEPKEHDCYQSLLKIKEAFSAHKDIETKYVLNFCDDLYYGTKDMSFETETNPEIEETAKAGIRSGYLKNLSFIDSGYAAAATPTKKKADTTMSTNDLREGKYIVPWEWNAEQALKVPALSTLDDYIPNEVFYSIVKKVSTRTNKVLSRIDMGATGIDAIKKDYVNLFITGKPGTGKTTLAYALGAATGMPVYTIPMTKNTEEDTFQGMTKIVEGKMAFVSTDFLYAYEHGGIIVLEEINLPDPSVIMGSIGQSIEFPFVLMKDGYEPVRRHPMCIIIGTMNVGTYGSKGINQALSSRFRQTYLLDDPNKDDFLSILMKQGCSKADASYVFKAYEKIIAYLKTPKVNAEDICMNVTMRSCIGALENIEEGESRREAIKNTIIGKIAEEDIALAEDVFKHVVEVLPD